MSESLFDLSGRVAVVIGGTTGLGREIALGMAAAGADVAPSSRRQEPVDEVAAAIEALGRRSLRVTCDVLDRASIERLHDAVLKAFGKVDILVNAAGITQKVASLEVSDADWSRVIETNLTGTMRACQIFGKTMAKVGYGRIVNIASITAFQGFCRVAACRVRSERQRDCAGSFSDASQHVPHQRHAARRRASNSYTDASIWQPERGGGAGHLSGLSGSGVRHGRGDRGGWRFPGQWREPVERERDRRNVV
jgi:NAD(P)-dependent dehydrogenase (short-subunit alcohol dehydrogenase family)